MIADDHLRIAILGAGNISRRHLRGIDEHVNVICTALCDSSHAQLELRSREVKNSVSLFSDIDELVTDGSEMFDAAIICLPHHLHASAVIACANAGKHVLCEKPLCTRLADAQAISDAVAQAAIVFVAGHNHVFSPLVAVAKEQLANGAVGTPMWLRTQDCFVHPRHLEGTWRANVKHQGGGELIDTGYHPTYTNLYLAGARAVTVNSVMGRFTMGIDGEDTASVQILYENGAIGEILSSWSFENPAGSAKIHIIGTQAEMWGDDTALFLAKQGEIQRRWELKVCDTFAAQIDHFYNCVCGSQTPLQSLNDSRETLRVILTATESAKEWRALVSGSTLTSDAPSTL